MEDYNVFYDYIIRHGASVYPRGLGAVCIYDNVFQFIPGTIIRRKGDNPSIGFIEMFQFIAGYFDHNEIKALAPHARLELFTQQSAYGPRTSGKFEKIISELSMDRFSRRAVVLIANNNDTPETLPCTTSMQFQVRNDSLLTTVTMRSSDAVWGLGYDAIQFGGIAMCIASCLKIKPGIVQVNMANSHVYNETRVKVLTYEYRFWYDNPFNVPNDFHDWDDARTWALEMKRLLLANKTAFHAIFTLGDKGAYYEKDI